MSQTADVLLEGEESSLEVISEAEERFDQLRRRSGFYLAPLVFATVFFLTHGSLSPEGSRLSAVLTGVLVLWMTEAIPMPMTAILGASLCVLLGVADAKTVFGPFADPIIFLFVGSFILARAMMLHRLDRRFALTILSPRWVRSHPARLLAALGLVTALISMWVSNTATTAMMLPIALGVLNALKDLGKGKSGSPLNASRWPFATGFMLMVAYSASIGGIGTPVGSPPNLIGIGLIKKLAHVDINFFQWMAVGVPLSLAMYTVLFLLLYRLHPAEKQEISDAPNLGAYMRTEREALGEWTVGQVNTLVAFGVGIVLWVTPGIFNAALGAEHPYVKLASERLPEGVVALLAASLLFMLPTRARKGEFTLNWQEATRIDWGTILLFGGGLSLGGLMFSTGVAEVMGKAITGLIGSNSLWGLTGVSIAMAIVMSEATSNTATANMIIPVVIAIAQAAHVNPVPPALGACLGASYGFMLPVSTAPNAIVYGTGLVPIPKMVRAGVLFDLCGFLIIWIGLRLLCPLLGWG